MKETINEHGFMRAFETRRPNNFSYKGQKALFAYLEQYEESTGEELELDVIALCCKYTEYESLEDFQKEYSKDYESIDDVENETQIIRIDDDSFIIQCF